MRKILLMSTCNFKLRGNDNKNMFMFTNKQQLLLLSTIIDTGATEEVFKETF